MHVLVDSSLNINNFVVLFAQSQNQVVSCNQLFFQQHSEVHG